MVIGVLAAASQAETCLNNLSEQDFDLSRVSVVIQDMRKRNALARDTGPLQGATMANLPDRLRALGVTPKDIQLYVSAVNAGQVLIAIDCPPESQSAALETLKDYAPKVAKILRGKKRMSSSRQ